MTHDSKLIEKIQAILRKADESRNPSEAEREEAMRAANRLLLKHGLSMQDLGDLGDDTTTPGREHEHTSAFATEGDQDYWRGELLFRLAKIYFCHVYRGWHPRKSHYHWMILGRGDYVRALRTMHEYVAPQVEREFNVAVSKMTQHRRYARRWALHAATVMGLTDVETYVEETTGGRLSVEVTNEDLARLGREYFESLVSDMGIDAALRQIQVLIGCNELNANRTRQKIIKEDIAPASPGNLGVWRRSFFFAANMRIASRLREMMREDVKEMGEPGMALVKNEKRDLDDFIESLDLGLSSNRSGRELDDEGMALGREAGDRADLSPHNKVRATGRKELAS
jgi:hypothetical protein